MTYEQIVAQQLNTYPWLVPLFVLLLTVGVIALVVMFVHASRKRGLRKLFGAEFGEETEGQKNDLKAKTSLASPTSISGCTGFFKEKESHRELRIFALSGQRFLETIHENRMTVDSVRIIVPSEEAIKAYFGNNDEAFRLVKKDIDSICNGTTTNKLNGLVKRVETKRIGSFPLTFYAIFSDKLAMSGVYAISDMRQHTIGLKSRAWIDPDKNSVEERLSQFDALWSLA